MHVAKPDSFEFRQMTKGRRLDRDKLNMSDLSRDGSAVRRPMKRRIDQSLTSTRSQGKRMVQDKSFRCELNVKPKVMPKAIGKKIVKPIACLDSKEKPVVKKVYAGFMKSSDLNPLNTSSCQTTPREAKRSKSRHPSRPKSTINLFAGP